LPVKTAGGCFYFQGVSAYPPLSHFGYACEKAQIGRIIECCAELNPAPFEGCSDGFCCIARDELRTDWESGGSTARSPDQVRCAVFFLRWQDVVEGCSICSECSKKFLCLRHFEQLNILNIGVGSESLLTHPPFSASPTVWQMSRGTAQFVQNVQKGQSPTLF